MPRSVAFLLPRRALWLALFTALISPPLFASAESDAAAVPADAATLDTVTVTAPIAKDSGTATKTKTPIIEIPQSISVITDRQIADRGIHGIEEAVWYTAGAQGGGYGPDPRSDWLLLRGFTPARYLDGLAVPDGSITGITRIEPYGLQSVEVLKGPASVNYGAMPPGGMVNYVSKQPTEQAFGEVQAQYGSFATKELAVDVGGPLNQDETLLYRLTALVRKGNNPVDYVHDNRYYFAPALTWKPDGDTKFTLLGRFQKTDTVAGGGFLPAEGTLLPSPFGKIPTDLYTGEPGYNQYDVTMKSIGYEFEHDFGRGIVFHSNLRYGTTDLSPNMTVGAFGLLDDQRSLSRYLYPTMENSRSLGFDNNVQFRFGDGVEHTILAGIDYRRSRDEAASAFAFGVASLDVYDPVYGSPVPSIPYSTHTNQLQTQTGVYVQDQIKVDHWIVNIGGRQDWVTTDTDDLIADARGNQSDKKFSDRIGVNYLFDNGIAPYVGYSQSFQPTVGTAFDGRAFVPTTGDQIEAGIKYQPKDATLLLTAAIYELTQQNTLTVDPNHTLYSVQQGETKVKGLELEGRWNIGRGLSVYGAYTYIDSKVTQSTDPLALGKEIALQPKQTASVGADYTFTDGPLSGLGFGGGVRYVGDHYGDTYNQWKTPAYTLLDASIHYDTGPWRLQLNASNLTNKEYVSACNSAAWCYYGYPRVVMATARYQW